MKARILRWLACAALLSCGCDVFPLPPAGGCENLLPPSQGTQHTLQIEVVGGANVNVAGGADVTVKNAATGQSKSMLCPCCGDTGFCQGLCGKAACNCSRGQNSAASTAGNVAALPQFTTQTQMVWQCRGGKCDWYPVEVQVPLATAGKRLAAPTTHGGKVTIYDNGSPAGRAMRDAIGSKGLEWKREVSPVAIGGTHWSPTAVKPDGSAWTPGSAGWHSQSAAQFEAWLSQ